METIDCISDFQKSTRIPHEVYAKNRQKQVKTFLKCVQNQKIEQQ